ncbi:MAG TPA: histidine kinase [Fibrobacteres bacterium]|jgi:CBS domain-containing protein|nr:histidine kinase [Fibrobacterota bacterium]
METIEQLLRKKDRTVWSVHPNATVYEAIELMALKEIGALAVVENDQLAGMLSERDYARNVVLKGRSSRDTVVREIMTPPELRVRPDYTVEECMEMMTEERVRHLPVMDGDRLLGIVSIGDLVKSVISEQQFMIRQLEQYIGG